MGNGQLMAAAKINTLDSYRKKWQNLIKKYSNKLSMKALVEKDISMKKQEKEMRKAPHSFYVHLSRKLKGTQGNSRELKGTQGNSSELI